MKKLLSLIFFLLPLIGFASGVTVVRNNQGLWDVFYTSPNGKQFLIYKDKYQIDSQSGLGGLLYKTRGNIFSILYGCYENRDNSCLRYINTATDQISRVIYNPALMVDANSNVIGPIDNLKNGVILIFNYPQDDKYLVTTIFQNCNHPFIYKIPQDSTGTDIDSKFLDNGDLHLNMTMPSSPDQVVTIHIDYDQLYKNCTD